MPVMLRGPLRDKQPVKHNRVQLHRVSLGLGSPGCRSIEGPWGLEEAKAGGRPFLRPRGGRRGKEVPPNGGEGSVETENSGCVCVCVCESVCVCVCVCVVPQEVISDCDS